MHAKLFSITTIILLMGALAILCECSSHKTENPRAVRGTIDFTGWDFTRDGAASLDGEWEFYPSQFLNPGDVTKPKADYRARFMHVPGGWNPGWRIYSGTLASGYATYRLRIIIGNRHISGIGLRIGFVRSAYRLYVNGELVHEAGQPGTSAASTLPCFSDQVVPLPQAKGVYDVIIQVANYHFPAGGIIGRIVIGSKSRLEHSLQVDNLLTIFRVSILILLGLYQLLIFSLQRTEHQYLFLALICWCFIPELSGSDKSYWSSVIPFITWWRSYIWSHVLYCMGFSFFIAYLRRLFPMDVPRSLMWTAVICNGAMAAVMFMIPAEYIKYMLLPFHLLAASMLFLSVFILIRTAVMRRQNALFVQLGLAVLVCSAMFDLLLPLFFKMLVPLGVPSVSLFPMGTLLMCVLQVIDMTREFIRTKHHAAHLAADNETLKALLERRIRSAPHRMTDAIEVKIHAAIEYLHENYREDISRENLSAAIDLHPDNFSRYFKKYTGKKYNEYITGLRITEAMRLLRETDESIIDIAMNVGFGTLRNFNYAFFSVTGHTPSDFRKSYRSSGEKKDT